MEASNGVSNMWKQPHWDWGNWLSQASIETCFGKRFCGEIRNFLEARKFDNPAFGILPIFISLKVILYFSHCKNSTCQCIMIIQDLIWAIKRIIPLLLITEVGSGLISTLQMIKWKLRVKWLIQNYTSNKWQSQDPHSHLCNSKACSLYLFS